MSKNQCKENGSTAQSEIHGLRFHTRARNFTETSPLIVALTFLRALLAIAIEQDMEIKQLNVDLTFLYGNLNQEIYL